MKTTILTILFLTACIHEPTRQKDAFAGTELASPRPTAQQLADCGRFKAAHNAWTVVGTLLGGATSVQGGAETLVSSQAAKTGIAIGSVSTGVLGVVAAVLAGTNASSYADQNCTAVLSAQP